MIHCPMPVHGHAIDCGFVDLGYLKIIILGIVQGITELLPISSTAHLRIVPSLLGWHDPGTPFTGAVQLASFFAVMIYFRKEIARILFGFFAATKEKKWQSPDFKIGAGLVVGSIPVGVCGLLLKPILNQPQTPLRSIYVVGAACVIMGLLLLWVEKVSQKKRDFSQLTLKDGVLVGVAQATALIPGVSRSGATLTAGLFLGMTRETAAAFSFILGVPVIVAAGLKEIHELYSAHLSAYGWNLLGVGLLTASVAAFAAVYALMKYLETRSTHIFAWYRVALGLILLAGAGLGWLH